MRITVYKAMRRLALTDGDGVCVWECDVCLGSSPVGAKEIEGDGKTPEGAYRIATKNPKSRFHISMGLSYPNAADARAAFAMGRIDPETLADIETAERDGKRPPWDTPLGGFIMLHGEHPDGRRGDWTAGCVAMRNADIERLYALVDIGVEVTILP